MGASVAKTILGLPVVITEKEFLEHFVRQATTEELTRSATLLLNSINKSSFTLTGAIDAGKNKMADQNLFFKNDAEKLYPNIRENFFRGINLFRPDPTSIRTRVESGNRLLTLLCEFHCLKTGDNTKRQDLQKIMEEIGKIFNSPENRNPEKTLQIIKLNLAVFRDSVMDSIDKDPCDLDGEPTTRQDFYSLTS